jgi:hypothetical protein
LLSVRVVGGLFARQVLSCATGTIAPRTPRFRVVVVGRAESLPTVCLVEPGAAFLTLGPVVDAERHLLNMPVGDLHERRVSIFRREADFDLPSVGVDDVAGGELRCDVPGVGVDDVAERASGG